MNSKKKNQSKNQIQWEDFEQNSLQLQAGCLTIAIVTIIFELLNIVLLVVASKDNIATADSKTLKLVKNHLPWLRKNNLTLGSGQWSLDNLEKIRNIQLWLENVDILISVISVISCGLLIFGVLQSRYKFIFPTLIWMPVDVAIYLMNIMVVFLFNVYRVDIYIVQIVYIVAIVFNLLISLACWLFVYSFWQQVE